MRSLLFFLLLTILVPAPALAAELAEDVKEPEEQGLGVNSAILYDLTTNTVLFEQNADARIQPASLTKIMSMFLALDQISQGHLRFDSPVLVSKKAASEGGSRMGIRAGEEIRLGELLLGMAVSSGNDASYAVAEFVGGSNEAFVQAMNDKAQRLGMHDTWFCTPNGLPMQGQYTTARDMLILARAYLQRYPWALSLHNTRVLKHLNYVSWNKNPLLNQYPGCDGLKTGWVRASGYNMIFTAQRGNHRLLAVILGAPDPLHRGVEACRMLDAGFLVCAQKEPTVLDALSHLPFESYQLDLHKNAHEAVALYGYVSSGLKGRKHHLKGRKAASSNRKVSSKKKDRRGARQKAKASSRKKKRHS